MHPSVSTSEAASAERARAVLFVDLDGTLIKGDLLHEALLATLKSSPRLLLASLLSLRHGRSSFKRSLAQGSFPDVRHLPFREEVLDLIAEARARGDRIVLATAADESWARAVASELGLFDDVLASNGPQNLKGQEKLLAIRTYCERHGHENFDYVGDCHADLPIWAEARQAFAVFPSARLATALRDQVGPFKSIGSRGRPIKAILRALRPHQWAKNLLIFVPLITSHRVLERAALIPAILSFVSFCLCASSIYILNDLFDLNADRRHPVKRLRPFASAELPAAIGVVLSLSLAVAGLGLAGALLPLPFTILLAVYAAVSTAYSLWIKRVVMLDVVTLACLYAVRVLGGGLGTLIPVSEWLMAFSLFIFLSLAFAKRYAELARMEATEDHTASGRGYQVSDLSLIESMGSACGFLAVLVLALYIQSEQMRRLYDQTWALWLLCPLLAYWIGRIWILAKRRILGEDAVVFAIRDPVSLFLALIATMLLAIGAGK